MAAKKKFNNPSKLLLNLNRELRDDFKTAVTLNKSESSQEIRAFMKKYIEKTFKEHGLEVSNG